MSEQVEATSAVPGVAGRAAVTVGVVAAILVLERVPLPQLDLYLLREVFGLSAPREVFGLFVPRGGLGIFAGAAFARQLSVLALGIRPLLAAFLLVELVAVVVPALRPLRHGRPEGRARLTRAAWLLGAALAAFQGWGVARYLASIRTPGGLQVFEEGAWPALAVASTLAAGTLLAGWLAELVTRRGLGNGFAVLVAVEAAFDLGGLGLRMLLRGPWGEGGLVLLVVLAVLLPLLASRLLRARGATPMVPVPTCGLVVLKGPAAILAFPAGLAALVPAARPLAQLVTPGGMAYSAVRVALTLPLAWVLSRLFCPPAQVEAAWRRAGAGDLAPDVAATVGAAVRAAHLRSLGLVMGVALFPLVAEALGVPVWIGVDALVGAAVVGAVALDLAAEWRARRRAALVAAAPVYRLYAVQPARSALAEEGIDAVARGPRFRALFHFFAPYAPVELLVAPERAAQAASVCARVEAGATPR